ncbi:DnaJ domain-containing protein [Nocardioides sp. InS609-2]|uniref:J domain-containing protein n=1 Tax=Nocardioides sp. InS609-2 TaxID=2760705 RepID=UPI0017D79811|nr:DnaJ domain-containing protein [Nocardioides sp. InS609-2]MBA3782217.1 hypothetical protein [Nocardioides sp.]
MSDNPTWYDLLGVDRAAPVDEIRAAWKSSIEGLEPGDRRFASLNKAAEVLLDPARRAAYDAELDGGRVLAPASPVLTARELSRERTRIEREVSKEQARQRRREEKIAGGGQAVTELSSSPSSMPAWLLAALAVAVLIVAGAAGVVFALSGDGDSEESSAAAQTAAEQAIVPILSYDYRHLDQDRAAAQSYLTADYKLQYDKTFTLVEQNSEAVRPVVVAKLVSSGLERSGADRVKVVLFVDQETTNKQTTEPVVYQNYVTVTMQKVDGEWLVDQLDTQG